MKILRKASTSALALSLVAGGAAFGQTALGDVYQFTALGPAWQSQLPSMGIDASGRVAGTCVYWEEGNVEFRAWTGDPANGYLVSPFDNSTINAVSPDGLLVGSASGVPTTFDWLGNPLQAYPGVTGCFMAVNRRHDLAGYVFDSTNNWTQTAVVYDRNGNRTLIGTPDLAGSAVYGINDLGTAVGYAMDAQANCNALYWNGQLTTLTGPFGNATVAVGINNLREVVGYTVTPMEQVLPIRWTVGEFRTTYSVIDLPAGFDNGTIGAINNYGDAVGTMWTPGGSSKAFLIRRDGTFVVLNDLRPAGARVYDLVSANAINASGSITGIAAVRIHQGAEPQYVAYVLMPMRVVGIGHGRP